MSNLNPGDSPKSGGPVSAEQIADLAAASRVLVAQGVVDAFGHVSMRHPHAPERYLMARSIAPGLVTPDDIIEYDLDSNPCNADGRSSFATWFTRIGINSALMILRKRRIRLETSIDATAEGETWQTWQIADHSVDPEKHYVGHERSAHLKNAICRLPSALRLVVECGQMEGHSMKQIAHNMGISIPATKSRLARAKVALRKSMVSASVTRMPCTNSPFLPTRFRRSSICGPPP